MSIDRKIVLYHAPNTRSSIALTLLEEIGAPYDLEAIDIKAGEQRQPAYLAVNPMGKVPAVTHGDALITEQVAIFLYLADLFPEAGLAPAIGDPLRGPYLRWMVYYAACFEPAVGDRALKREPGPPSMMAYGDFDSVIDTVTTQLAEGPYMLGRKFSAADVIWGSGLSWTTKFQLIPERPAIKAYIERFESRPSVARAKAIDAELAARHGA
ncbi:MAG: glutathione S-transferase [Alphaproteobacteria bacterium]|nr:glutathione S-transferase [Alphaproteobacteria bacterium]